MKKKTENNEPGQNIIEEKKVSLRFVVSGQEGSIGQKVVDRRQRLALLRLRVGEVQRRRLQEKV